MDLTVAIVTHNRAQSLQRTLSSLTRAQAPPDFRFEVCIVLNACTDDSAAVVDAFADHLPLFALTEPRAGISQARNAAIAGSRGEAIAWIDDDVSVDPDWLSSYAEALREHPEVSFFGGPIQPTFPVEIPAWFQASWRHFANAFAMREVAADAPVQPDSLPYGANFLVRSACQRQFPYDERLGRRPGLLVMGQEETSLLRRIMAAGGRGRWVKRAGVLHHIDASRCRRRYLLRYVAGDGFMAARLEALGLRTFSLRLLLELLRIGIGLPQWLLGELLARHHLRARGMIAVAYGIGALSGCCAGRLAPTTFNAGNTRPC